MVWIYHNWLIYSFSISFLFLILTWGCVLERGKGRDRQTDRQGERETETLIGCLLYVPDEGSNPQAKHVSWPKSRTCNLLVYGMMLQPTEPHGQDLLILFDGQLVCGQFLAAVNKTSMSICIPLFFWGHMPLFPLSLFLGVQLLRHKLGYVELYKTCYIVFQSDGIFIFPQAMYESCTCFINTWYSHSLNLPRWWYLTVVLIYIFLIT